MDDNNQRPPYDQPPQYDQSQSNFQQPPPQYQQPPNYNQPPPDYYQQQPPPNYYQQQPPPPNYQQPPPNYYQPPPQAPPQYGPPVYNQPVGFLQAYKAYWKNYVNFNDKTSRAGYWWVFLMNMIINIVLMVIMMVSTASLLSYGLGDPINIYDGAAASALSMSWLGGFMAFYIIYSIWGFANLIPGIAIVVRRLHDTGKAWYWIFIAFIPIAGAIILIVFLATASKYGPDNQYAYLRQV